MPLSATGSGMALFPPARHPLQLPFESQATQKSQASEWMPVIFGGDGGIRTLDLTDANRTLSQLSYAPILNCMISSQLTAHTL